ncbi:MAG TPA: DUF4349 domain-containing protein [Acidimicrobiia bacterium]|nr:DUF4349 domain-containing protein [Acidimicrobiia bacterium]
MRRRRRTGSSTRFVAAVGVLLLVVGACSGQDSGDFGQLTAQNSNSDGSGRASTGTTVAASTEDSDRGGGDSAPQEAPNRDDLGDGGVAPVALPNQVGRDIIFTAEMTVAVSDVGAAGEQATQEIQRLGGFLFGQRTTGAPNPSSVLTFKVRPEDFQAALAALGSIGELRDQNVTASDVTERIVDLESRIQTAAASVERLRILLGEATDIEAIVELESELLARETELETLRGSLRTLQDQVSLATIALTITQAASNPQLTVEATAYPVHDSGMSCPGEAELQVETATETTLCFEITNAGDTWLDDFELRDPVLDVVLDDLVVVFGDPAGSLEPGDSLIVAAEVTPERDLRTQTTVTARAVDEEGTELGSRPVSRTVTVFVDTVDPGGIPSFTEGLQASWQLLVRLGQTLVLALGALIPFFWIPLLGWFAWTRMRRPAKAEE